MHCFFAGKIPSKMTIGFVSQIDPPQNKWVMNVMNPSCSNSSPSILSSVLSFPQKKKTWKNLGPDLIHFMTPPNLPQTPRPSQGWPWYSVPHLHDQRSASGDKSWRSQRARSRLMSLWTPVNSTGIYLPIYIYHHLPITFNHSCRLCTIFPWMVLLMATRNLAWKPVEGKVVEIPIF